MTWIDQDRELDRLEASFEKHLTRHMPEFVPAAQSALQRLRLRRGDQRRWVTSFSPLVVLYPLLLAECLGPAARPLARRANLAHLLLLISSFLEDRHLDGELSTERSELLLTKTFLREALRLIGNLGANQVAVERLIGTTLARYHVAQLRPYTDGPRPGEQRGWVREIIAGRAALGSLSSRAMLLAARMPRRLREQADEAYDAIVVGMQWEDDLTDWTKDLEGGSENLLLYLLSQSDPMNSDRTSELPPVLIPGDGSLTSLSPSAPAKHSQSSAAAEITGAMLRQHELLDLAAHAVDLEWTQATSLLTRLGAHLSAELLEQRQSRVASATFAG